ncbi:MAG: metalloregulator ArsR/SmtB family transcription factor [Firmicutes bacterium]|nr:metalloregulator ArsR/SmtB family transcription factor [Bacillota bacterium]
MSKTDVASLVDLFKVLGHPLRLRLLALLKEGELCVCQLVEILDVPTSTVSERLKELRSAGLLEERKEGRWVHYRLAPQPRWDSLLEELWPHLEQGREVARDRKAAAKTRSIALEVTCNAQGGRHGR